MPLILRSFPRAIIHIDADAFFASCEQSLRPELKGRPVVTGKERGIAASLSYEAKLLGASRGMTLREIKKLIPDVVILPSDYETYSLLSKRFFDIVRRFTPDVEEYGIDECFADITGLRRPLHMSYTEIAEKIRDTLKDELGFTFSIGLAPTKVLAKIASKWKKPDGLTIISGRRAHEFLGQLTIGAVWGIGPQTSAYLNKQGIDTALQFALKPEDWVRRMLTKPHCEIWLELRCVSVYTINTATKESYQSISKTKTFTPPSNDREFVLSQLSRNIENACIKARRYHLAANHFFFFLKTQDFRFRGMELRISHKTSSPNEILGCITRSGDALGPFDQVFSGSDLYRATGIVLMDLETDDNPQPDLFGHVIEAEIKKRVFESVDRIDKKFGKHTVFIASSFQADHFDQHLGERGDKPLRTTRLLKGETKRRHLSVPLFQEVLN